MIQTLIANPIAGLRMMLFMLPGLIFGMGLHEWAHAYAAVRMGDDTPKKMGRLTLNPIKHIDWTGFALFLILGFGWAKPVPTNALYYDNRRKGRIVVSAAGIAANLALCVIFGLLYRLAAHVPGSAGAVLCDVAYYALDVNAMLAVLNLLPIAPLDGSKLFAALFPNALGALTQLDRYGMALLLILSITGILGTVLHFATYWIVFAALLIWSFV